MPGVSITARHRGRHTAASRPVTDNIVTRAWAWPVGLAVAVAVLIWLLAGSLIEALFRAVRFTWRWLEPQGRLMCLVFFSWPLGKCLGDVHLIPDHAPWTTAAAVAIGCAAGGWLLAIKLRGQRTWRRSRGRGNPVIQGGEWAPVAARQVAGFKRLEEAEDWIAELRLERDSDRARIDLVYEMLRDICARNRISMPQDPQERRRRLRLVGGSRDTL